MECPVLINEKFVRKYLRMAKQVGEDSNPCYSRQIGAIIVNPAENRILGTGYNGPPAGTPHCDEPEYLLNMVWPYMTEEDRKKAHIPNCSEEHQKRWFLDVYGRCKKCPRRMLGIPSGERMHLCSCEHAEKNAIFNAAQSVHGAWMICYCGLPCIDCTKAIINAGIRQVICIHWKKDYSPQSRWLFKEANVIIEERDEMTLDVINMSWNA